MSKQVFDRFCTCRVFKDRGGDVHIVSDGCPVCNPDTTADALAAALPTKRDEDRWKSYEDAAESFLTPRQIFTHIPIEGEDVELMYGGRKRARG